MADLIERETEQSDNRADQPIVNRQANHVGGDETVNRAVRVVWFVVGLLVTLLLVRVVLALLGANLENQFANFIYVVTDPFVVGFRGLLQISQFQAGVSRLELETLVAAVVYGLIGWGVASAIQLFSKRG